MATLNIALGQHVDAEGARRSPGARLSETSEPSVELMRTLKLMSPSPIVTGSISSRTLAHARIARVENEISKWKPSLRSIGRAIANWTTVPTRMPIA